VNPISVVIPSLNGSDLLAAFLPDLLQALETAGGDHQVIVVDNASTDGTVDLLADRFPQIEVVSLEENRGFAAAVNTGLETVKHPWVLSLNNDIRVEADFLEPLVSATEDPDLFSAVPRILLPTFGGCVESVMEAEFTDGFIQFSQPGLAVKGPSFDRPRDVFFAVGGCGLYHTARLKELGGFDAAYHPFYWEDIDLGYRAWRRGWTVRYVPESIVHHRHRGTISRKYSDSEVKRAMLKNQLLFHWKNLHDPGMLENHLYGILFRLLGEDVRGDRAFLESLVLALEDAGLFLPKRAAEAGFSGEVPMKKQPPPVIS